MASIIIFSTMWGWILHEWKGSSKKAHLLIAGGIVTLVLSTMIIGAGAGGRIYRPLFIIHCEPPGPCSSLAPAGGVSPVNAR